MGVGHQGVTDEPFSQLRVAAFTQRWARPAEAPRLDVLACDQNLAVVQEILERVDPALAEMGEDPTEIMERIRVERMRAKNAQG